MSFAIFVASIIGAYLLGSISSSYFIVRMRRGADLRDVGSGNLGATNAGRLLGRKYAILIFWLDFAKGALAVLLPTWVFAHPYHGDLPVVVFTGFAAIIGHVFPFYLGFRGGKGVATAGGVVTALSPLTALLSFFAWIVTLRLTRMVAAASVVAAVTLPIAYYFVGDGEPGHVWRVGLFALAAILVVVMHRSNLARMTQGTEPRIGNR